ncbi:acyl-CoA dehydrogenase family protein [Paenibacillus thermotolerans]|uniref:acyl-CoA dehydrogenase family protein n=1 Tax=Paenibacillus thermotolerans TaxID=3027807 RepID=UPI00236870C3|nr:MULTISPECIES: acyl-CoA dehydrogenase family protein [unclassified Paenibacillus]
MTVTNNPNQKIVGGSFVIDNISPEQVMTPEDFSEEQLMFAETTRGFVEAEVLPHDERIEKLDYELTVELMRKAGELGLLSADIPEQYGGLGLDKVSSTIINENLSKASSFALSIGAHVGIGTLPIVFFGTEQQKRKYLPKLATGELIAAYCLTEPASGSDALGAKTTAKLSEAGTEYVLNGSKIFITNGGFADIFIVYAKIDGTDFSAFIVERGTPGFSIGPEEKKMGIKGSSTVPLFFEDARIPAENLLGERGKGHLIAFNILNIGRFKLGAGCLGGAKESIALAASYANTRTQFGKPIASFPLIGKKLADMNIRTYVMESMVYRTAGLIDNILRDLDYSAPDAGLRSAKGIAEYALECSINKVFASEGLDFVADEGVQIHGGYGYTQEYKIERVYRDSRINRIFEGTNEINRLLIPGTLLKKAMKGELPLLQKAQQFQNDLLSLVPAAQFENTLEQETHLVSMMKNIFLFTGGLAVQKYGMNLEKEQEALSNLADIMIQMYAAESALLRTKKRLAKKGSENAVQMTQVFVQEAFERAESLAKESLAAMADGDTLRTQLSILKKLTRYQPINTVALKRDIAARVIQSKKYVG